MQIQNPTTIAYYYSTLKRLSEMANNRSWKKEKKKMQKNVRKSQKGPCFFQLQNTDKKIIQSDFVAKFCNFVVFFGLKINMDLVENNS